MGAMGGHCLEAGRAVLLRDTPLMEHCRRRFGRRAKDLITYFAPESGRYCVAIMRGRVSGRVTEIFSYRHLSEVAPSHLRLIKYFFSGTKRRQDAKMHRNRVIAAERAEIRDRGDRAHEREDKKRFFIRRLRTTQQDHPRLVLPHIAHLVR